MGICLQTRMDATECTPDEGLQSPDGVAASRSRRASKRAQEGAFEPRPKLPKPSEPNVRTLVLRAAVSTALLPLCPICRAQRVPAANQVALHLWTGTAPTQSADAPSSVQRMCRAAFACCNALR